MCLRERVIAEEYLKKALSISKDISDDQTEFQCYLNLALTTESYQNKRSRKPSPIWVKAPSQ